jgi:hypothetical protein
MKFWSLALLALAVDVEYVSAFVPSGFNGRNHNSRQASVAVDMATEPDVSIQYDAAARLAYDGWRDDYLRGGFDPVRYEVFKENYEAIAVINVSAKKKARDEGTASPSLLNLNQYADYTAEEYEAEMKGKEPKKAKESSTTGDVLGQAMEAAESQMAASAALQDAADGLAEEEEVGCMFFGLDWILG